MTTEMTCERCGKKLYDGIHTCTPKVDSYVSKTTKIYGWFDDNSATPTYDPPHDANCPYCGKALIEGDVRTHCLMYIGNNFRPASNARSYFYRTHRTCADISLQNQMDEKILNMIEANND